MSLLLKDKNIKAINSRLKIISRKCSIRMSLLLTAFLKLNKIKNQNIKIELKTNTF